MANYLNLKKHLGLRTSWRVDPYNEVATLWHSPFVLSLVASGFCKNANRKHQVSHE